MRMRNTIAAVILCAAFIQILPARAADVTFNDTALESALRSTLGIPQGTPIQESDLADPTFTSFTARKKGIKDLTGLEHSIYLRELNLEYNSISNIDALQDLTMLREIQLQRNQITDITPLVNNTGLNSGDRIYLHGNPISAEVRSTQIPALEARDVGC